MRINELTTFQGTPGDNDFLPIDNGSETAKVPASVLGVSTSMSVAEAISGTSDDKRVMTPSVFKTAVDELAEAKAAEAASEVKVTVFSIQGLDTLPIIAGDSSTTISEDMVVLKADLSNPAAQTSEWDVSTSNGSITISGTITGATDLTLYLMKANV